MRFSTSSIHVVSTFLLATATVAALPVAGAGAAPILVTYSVTGGSGPGNGDPGDIVGGSITVALPNPGSGPTPITTANATVNFMLATEFGRNITRTLDAARFSQILAYRGLLKTLQVRMTSVYTSALGYTGNRRFTLSATPSGAFANGFYGMFYTTGSTGFFWSGITGQEISVPEPAPSLRLGSVAFGLAAPVLVFVLRRSMPRSRR